MDCPRQIVADYRKRPLDNAAIDSKHEVVESASNTSTLRRFAPLPEHGIFAVFGDSRFHAPPQHGSAACDCTKVVPNSIQVFKIDCSIVIRVAKDAGFHGSEIVAKAVKVDKVGGQAIPQPF